MPTPPSPRMSSTDRQAVKVFLSCTSKDLFAHRERVRGVCEARGYGIIDMTGFGAQNRTALETSLREIAPAQVFVGLYAHRYGYIPAGSDVSITEAEFHEGTRLSKPRLPFVIEPTYVGPYDEAKTQAARAIPDAEKTDRDRLLAYRDEPEMHNGISKGEKLAAFLAQVGRRLTWDTFTTPDHLAGRVLLALSNWEGWRVNVPAKPNRQYIGRENQLAEIADLLVSGRRVGLVGLLGIGKTQTADEIAFRLRAHYTGGVLWAELGAEARDEKQVLASTMRTWSQVHHPGRLQPEDGLHPHLVKDWLSEAPGPLLVIIDDVWHPRTAQSLLQLIPDDAALLVTSRHADMLQNLGLAAVREIDKLSEEEGMALLRNRVGSMPRTTALRRLVEIVDGHPLALEIAASLIESTTNDDPDYADQLPDILEQQQRDGSMLSILQVPDEERNLSVEGVLALSYKRMSKDLQARFRALGVLADAPLPAELLWGLWQDETDTEEKRAEAAQRLQALVDRGMLSWRDGVYRLHRILGFYAQALLREKNETAAARYQTVVIERSDAVFRQPPDTWQAFEAGWAAHIRHVGNALAAAALAHLEPAPTLPDSVGTPDLASVATMMDTLRADNPDLAALLEKAPMADAPPYVEIVTDTQGQRLAEADPDLDRGLYDLGRTMPVGTMQASSAVAACSDFAAAVYRYIFNRYVGLAAARTLGQPGRVGVFTDSLASWHAQRGHNAAALAYHYEALAAALAQDDQRGAATTLSNIGAVYGGLGEPQTALEYYQQALALRRAVGDRGGAATTLSNIGAVYGGLGEPQTALEYYQQALALRRAVGDRDGEATTLYNMSYVVDPAEAIGLVEKALKLWRDIQSPHARRAAQRLAELRR